MSSSKTPRTDAEAKFARTQKRATDAQRALSDAAAEAKRIDENTARLRALRLARDAKEAAARETAVPVGTAAPAAKGKAKPKTARKGPGNLEAGKAIPVKRLNARNDG